jgi:hypothetical protein
MRHKEKPVLFVCGLEDVLGGNVSSPGRRLSIASRTPHGVNPDGKIDALVPRAEDLRFFAQKEISQEEFRERYYAWVGHQAASLAPGKLFWQPYSFFTQGDEQLVESGDVLFCTCLHAQKDGLECHRLWAAELLVRFGWKVVLDGDRV